MFGLMKAQQRENISLFAQLKAANESLSSSRFCPLEAWEAPDSDDFLLFELRFRFSSFCDSDLKYNS